MSDDPTQQKKRGLARLVSLLATALLFFSFFLPWFAWSWSCTGSDCQAVTLSLKTHPPVSSGFSVASNGVSLVSASASAPVGDRGVIAVRIDIDNFINLPFFLMLLVAPLFSLFLSSILTNLFKTSERGLHTQRPTQGRAQPTRGFFLNAGPPAGPPIVPDSSPSPTKPWKKRGLAILISLYEWNKGAWVLDTWKKRGLYILIYLIAVFFWAFVANNGASMVATGATVGDRAVIAVSTDSFRFPLLWLVLVISLVLFLSHILMNLFKTVARWEPPFTLMITAVALYVEILYMANAFGAIRGFTGSPTIPGTVDSNCSRSLCTTLTTSNPLVDATLYLSHGPSFGFWLGLFATLVVGGVAVVRGYRRSADML